MKWSKQNAIEICTSKEAYQVRTSMGQEETVSKQVKTNMEIARLNIPHTFLVGRTVSNCILDSNFLTKTATKVDFKAKRVAFVSRR